MGEGVGPLAYMLMPMRRALQLRKRNAPMGHEKPNAKRKCDRMESRRSGEGGRRSEERGGD